MVGIRNKTQRVKNGQLIRHLISFNFESHTYALLPLMGGTLMVGEELQTINLFSPELQNFKPGMPST